jgi:alpha-tubulin suppressor-like RCC1 family protein
MRLVTRLSILSVCLLASPCAAVTYTVRPDGSGDFPTIQAAINAASNGDVIELATGTFSGDGNRDLDYSGKSITVRSQTGSPEETVIDCGGSQASPHRGFYFHSGEGPEAVLQGVTITNGYSSLDGGAVYVEGTAGTTFLDCLMVANFAYEGGAIGCRGNGPPTFTTCTFSSNVAVLDGGAVYLAHWQGQGGSAEFTGCLFTENQSLREGGAVYCNLAAPLFTGCTFSGNTAIRGGAFVQAHGGSSTFMNCTVVDNSALMSPGGLCFGGVLPPTIGNTLVAFNTGDGVLCSGECEGWTPFCTDIFGNQGGDWTGCIAGQAELNGNFSLDPLFCDRPAGNLSLMGESPCAAESNPACGLVGSLGVACGQLGACCNPNSGHCLYVAEVNCPSGFDWHPEWTSCTPNNCPQPLGACCDLAHGWCTLETQFGCLGEWLGWGVPCIPTNPCPQLQGGCCFPDGSCQLVQAIECSSLGGGWLGSGTSCDSNPCDVGTCCDPSGACTLIYQLGCSGSWSLGGSCVPNSCPQPGACCLSDGSCLAALQSACEQGGGSFAGEGVSCSPYPCPQLPGACCYGPSCVLAIYPDCQGIWLGIGVPCDPSPCSQVGSGKVVAWGYNGRGQCDVPEPNSGFVAIAAGRHHSLGLKGDGSIVAWGYNNQGQLDVPLPNGDFVAIAGGGDHSLGLKRDGSITAWGEDDSGECTIPAPNSGFVAIAAGHDHNLGMKSDSSLVAWGDDSAGQCQIPEPNTGFVAIAAGYSHSLALKADGSIVAWGSGQFGQCQVPEPNSGFAAVAAGWDHSLGLKDDGSVVAWGWNDYGQLSPPPPNSGFVAIAGGYSHSIGLKIDGSIVAWGNNAWGQAGVPEPNSGFVAVAAGDSHNLGLTGIVGACCHVNATCTITTRVFCAAPDIWQGGSSSCSPDPCPQPAACCLPDGHCEYLTQASCASQTGQWRGPGTNCDPDLCPTSGIPAIASGGKEGFLGVVPNPFATATAFWYRLSEAEPVLLEVFDSGGQKVHSVQVGETGPGVHFIDWDGRGSGGDAVTSGVFFVRLTAGGRSWTRTLIRVK